MSQPTLPQTIDALGAMLGEANQNQNPEPDHNPMSHSNILKHLQKSQEKDREIAELKIEMEYHKKERNEQLKQKIKEMEHHKEHSRELKRKLEQKDDKIMELEDRKKYAEQIIENLQEELVSIKRSVEERGVQENILNRYHRDQAATMAEIRRSFVAFQQEMNGENVEDNGGEEGDGPQAPRRSNRVAQRNE